MPSRPAPKQTAGRKSPNKRPPAGKRIGTSPPAPAHPHAHEGARERRAQCAIVTVSDSRTSATDAGGDLAARLLGKNGHTVAHREIVPDDLERIWGRAARLLNGGTHDLILFTGGTGVSRRDVTPEALRPLMEKELPGFGELFRLLSHAEIGAAAFFSRALAGVCGRSLLVALPGSPAAVDLGLTKLLLPELGHLVFELRKHAPAAAGRKVHP